MAMGVDGLVSGLGTTDMINQLMAVEAAGQTSLKNKVTVQNKAVTAYQSVNTKLAALLTAAEALAGIGGFGATKVTSSSTAVAGSATSGAAHGSLTFDVTSLARAQVSTAFVAAAGPVAAGPSIDITIGAGTPVTIDISGDPSAQGVANAVNAANLGVKAAVVTASDGSKVLQFTATKTGVANGFTVTGLDAPVNNAITAQDAKIRIGDPLTGGYEVTSATNTFADLMPGVTVTASKVENGVTLDVSGDSDAVAEKVKALVDAANAALTEIATQTKMAEGKIAAGPLVGDSTLRKLSGDILSAVATGAGDIGSLSAVGVKLNRDGQIDFDKAKFLDALKNDPEKTRSYFDSYTNVAHANAKATAFDPGWDDAKGLARKLQTISQIATRGVRLPTDPADAPALEGTIPGMIKRKNDLIANLNDQVDRWDARLETRRAALTRQFSALEVALGKMQQQSSWLSGQIAGLPSYS